MSLDANKLVIDVVGLGVSEHAELSHAAQTALSQANRVIGSARQLQTVKALLPAYAQQQEQQELPKLSLLQEQLHSYEGRVVILASGDPLFYGIGRWLVKHFHALLKQGDLTFHPAISSLQAACHRLGIALQDVEVISLHGRPLATLKTRLRAFQPLLILTDQQSSPIAIAKVCVETGFADARITVLSKLGYTDESIRSFKAAELAETLDASTTESTQTINFDALHVTLLEPLENQGHLPQFPGIPDKHFITDGAKPGEGMLTKREVRLQILSLMQPQKNDVVWDIGAGCGGVAVEMGYWQNDCQVYAIEHHDARFSCLEANQQRFGVVKNLHAIQGRAPETLAILPAPNRVFIGGSDGSLPEILLNVWALLPKGGVLVVSAVTENTKQYMLSFMQTRQQEQDSDSESVQVAISRGSELAGQFMYRPNLPVSLFKFTKKDVLSTGFDSPSGSHPKEAL